MDARKEVDMYADKTNRQVGRGPEGYGVLWELSRSLFDDALVTCDDEREAAFLASARLLCLLENEKAGSRKDEREVSP